MLQHEDTLPIQIKSVIQKQNKRRLMIVDSSSPGTLLTPSPR